VFMARSRNIKPGFFANEDLAECDPLARILFTGLWCIADRAGRLEDRPKRIRAEVLPYDACDADQLLAQLEKHGFILRYVADGNPYIQVLNFEKHQNPHVKEAKSTIPAPASNGDETDAHGDSTVQEQCSTGASTEPAPDEHSINPADSLIPDSLIPDSGFPGGEGVQDIDSVGSEKTQPTPAQTSAPADLQPTVSHRSIALNMHLDLGNEKAMFLANARSKGRMSADWDAEFELWLRRSRNFGNGKDQQPVAGKARNGGASVSDQNREAAERAKARIFGGQPVVEKEINS
jgi:hypothetical protein